MKESRFAGERQLYAVRQAEAGVPVDEVCRKCGISAATFYRWRWHYGAMSSNELRRLKKLERENKQLRGSWRT